MRITVIGTRGIPKIQGGVETHCEFLYPHIVAEGNDVTIIRRESYCSNDKLNKYKGISLINIETPKKKSLEAIIHTFKAIWKARRINSDIVHIHSIGPALLTPFARLLGMKVVFTHHGPDYDRDKWGWFAKKTLKLGEYMGCKFANEIIVISKVIEESLKSKYKVENTHLIYNGVPAPTLTDSISYLKELNIKPKKYIFAMGRFVPEKNFHHIIEAFSSIRQTEYKLVIAGDADFEDDYSKFLKEFAINNNVILTGFIKGNQLNELLTNARVFVLSSSHEGLPIALLEAMSYELPVIISNIPANLAIGLNSSCYFEVGNITELANKLNTTLNNITTTVKYDMSNYDWNRIAKQTIKIYKKILNNSL